MSMTRIFDILDLYRVNYAGKEIAFARKVDANWNTYSSKDYLEMVELLSLGFLALGVKKGDKIGTITTNRPEWNFVDMSLAQVGAIHVPIYPTLSESDHEFIFRHAEIGMIFISDKLLLDKLMPSIKKVKLDDQVYTFNEIAGVKNWKEIAELGKAKKDEFSQMLQERKDSIKTEDLLTIIYTSGTTGSPKGVMLSHKNLLSNSMATGKMLPLNDTHRALSFLPLCHVYERMMVYNFQLNGVSIYYVENLAKIGEFIKEIKPHVFNTVPRLLEKVYDSIIAKGKDLTGIKKFLFFWAVRIGKRYDIHKSQGWYYDQRLKIARKLIFSKWRAGLGGSVNLIVSGGSALQTRLQRIFWAAEMPIYEGFGLTETSPVIAVNDPTNTDNVMFGTVGPALPGVTIKLAEDGEILAKGDGIMMGYYKDEAQTNEVIDQDGWLHTGDIGVMVEGRFLKITDRKKEIFKISSGKYIAPQVIENIFKESPFIEQLIVVGENQKFASAIISPSFNTLHFWAAKHKIHYHSNNDLITKPELISRIQKEVSHLNKRLGATEQIKKFRLVADEWSPVTGELSQTLKLKRKLVKARYDHLIKDIYAFEDKD
ncbi:MAG: long-chain fatty acid--CoA ligase [Bacteroidetes bacterium HGW-Bacteroidetes-17]|jgi:long-chain acyl-CoA synthetase|nr:MAG: long-chain fatty acid--CoA ligase [Bacteroidetes bacterium HGW-Bacteroidetes-17]